MTVISFDPGVTTGIAVIGAGRDVLYTCAVRTIEEVDEQIAFLQKVYSESRQVAELPPTSGHYRQHTQQVEERIRSAFPDVEWVPPGSWKRHPASDFSDLRGKTQHEKDAAGLGRWFRKTRRIGVTEHGKR